MEIFKLVVLWMLVGVAGIAEPAGSAQPTRFSQPAGSAQPTRFSQPAGFTAAVTRLLRDVRLPPERLLTVPILREDLERSLQMHWPGTKVTPFGAITAGLGTVSSDVDCFAELPVEVHDRTVFEMKSALEKHPHLFLQPTAVHEAKMPHVRFIHGPTRHQCDVSFRHRAGVRNTALINYLMRLDERASHLTILVKHWAKIHKPTGHRRIMSNYAMVSLAIFYLQQAGVLPAIASLQENAEEVILEQWNTGFNEIPYRPSNNESLFELLAGFFKYYHKFDFGGTIVSIFTGTPIKRSAFENVRTVPDRFKLYKRNVANGSSVALNINTAICVQDVFLHNINVASDCIPEVLLKFKSYLRFVVEAFATVKDDFLSVIMEPNDSYMLDKQTQVDYWMNSTSLNRLDTCIKN